MTTFDNKLLTRPAMSLGISKTTMRQDYAEAYVDYLEKHKPEVIEHLEKKLKKISTSAETYYLGHNSAVLEVIFLRMKVRESQKLK